MISRSYTLILKSPLKESKKSAKLHQTVNSHHHRRRRRRRRRNIAQSTHLSHTVTQHPSQQHSKDKRHAQGLNMCEF